MSDSFEQLIDIILAVVIMFLFPLLYIGQKQDALVQTYVSAETDAFTGKIRSKGYLTREMYELYQEQLSHTGMLFDVNIEHRHLVNEPEYRFRTADEVIEDQDSSYAGTNILIQLPISTDIPEVEAPTDGPLNTETNESILANAVNTPANSGHVHNDNCYLGTKHVHTGSSSSGGGCYGKYTSGVCGSMNLYDHNPYSVSGTGTTRCSVCNTLRKGSWVHFMCSHKCSKGHTVTPTYHSIYLYECGHAEDISNGNDAICTYNISGYELACNKIEGHYYDGNTEVFPVCNSLISNIASTHPVQTVFIGEPLITTVTATYLDGSTKVVEASGDFTADHVVENQMVTLTYMYSMGSRNYSITCTITVTVIPRDMVCQNGHTYNLNTDGSDPGCPYCRAWLRSLSVIEPASGTMTIFKGTTLSDNGVILLATYLDGHTQYLYDEYLDNLDNQYIGVQTVTMSYKGHYATIRVTTKRNLRVCTVCNRYYELYPDGTDPGCPYCIAQTPIFTGNVMTYYNDYYTDYILKELYEGSGTYYFSDRDFIEVSMKNGRGSLGSRRLAFFGTETPGMKVISSGYIREEVYPK